MELIEDAESKKLAKAKKRVEELKKFYTHLAMYFCINTTVSLIIIISGYNGSDFFGGSPFNYGTFAFWFLWGIGLFCHAIKVFMMGGNWEERQIQKYMNQEKEDLTKDH